MIRLCMLVLLLVSLTTAFAEEEWISRDFERIKMLIDEGPQALISPTDGITELGCAVLFPDNGISACLAVWQDMDFFDRCTYLKTNGFALARGILQYLNELNAVQLFRLRDPGIQPDEIAKKLNTLYAERSAFDCMLMTSMHMDYCVILFQRIAVRSEVVDALRFMDQVERELSARAPNR